MFGFRLKRIAFASSSLTALAWLTIVLGIATASVILVFLALPLVFAWHWVCASVLFAAAREIVEAGYP